MTQKTQTQHPKAPAATTNTAPAAPQELQPLKRWSYPFAQNNAQATGPQPYLAALGSAEDGSFPLGANGIWHGGIHFDHSTDAMLKQGEGVGVIADGEVVAYRLDNQYPELDYPDSKIALYSTSFVLVRHKLLLPSVAQLSGSTSGTAPAQNTGSSGAKSAAPASGASGAQSAGHASSAQNTAQPAPSTASTEPPADDVLEFYSLYMHLLDYAHYESAEKDASAANKAPAVQRMSYWQGDRHFVVGSKAKDQQVQPVDPMDEYFGNDDQDEAPPGADDDDAPADTPLATGTHIRNGPQHGKVLGILPRGSEITIVGTATSGYARIDKIISGAPVAQTAGDDVPADATTGWVFIGELDSKIIPKPLDSVVVLDKPFPVNAGDKVGYLGHYQRYRDASRLPPKDSRPLLHLEVFAGDKLKSFVDRCRDRCSSVGDKLQKPMLVISPGAKLVPTPSDADKVIDAGLKLVPVKGAPTGGPWVKVQPTRMPSTTAAHGHAQAHHSAGNHQPAGSPSGQPLWVESSMSGKNADGLMKGWTTFPLQIAKAAGPAVTYQDVIAPTELRQLTATQDDQQQHWWQVTVGTGKGESTTGWVCGKGHPATAWQSPWQWPGFEIVDNTSISIVDSFKRAVYVSKELFDSEEDEFKPSALGVNGSDLITKLEKAIDHDGNGAITAAELKQAQATAWLAEALSHLIVRYESEWGGSMGKWDQLSALMKDHKQLWQSELQRIEKLQWWSKVTGVKNFPSSPIVYHLHPIGFIGNFDNSQTNSQTLILTPKDVLDLKKTLQTEWVQFAGEMQAKGIIDTILNRVASGRFGPYHHFGSTVSEVVNQYNQFSDINGPIARNQHGRSSVEQIPESDISPRVDAFVDSYLRDRANGEASSVGTNLNYANPYYSSPGNLAWINALTGPRYGSGNAVHYHGTTPGLEPYRPAPFNVELSTSN